jgi:hypothetical protein
MQDDDESETIQEGGGMPIFLDNIERPILDVNSAEEHQPDEWFPANGPAQKLCRCATCLSDLEDGIESYLLTAHPKKRRIRMRMMMVPLHSLCVSLIDIINAVQSDQQIHSRLPKDCTKHLTQLRTWFVSKVPFDRKGKLGNLRNKIGAHLDQSTLPDELRKIAESADTTEIGEWIHLCLSVMCDLLKLDVYTWSASTGKEDQFILMSQEPLMAVLRTKDNHVVGLDGVLMMKRSPRNDVLERVSKLCETSQPLFTRDSAWQISGFYRDDPKFGWASSLRK